MTVYVDDMRRPANLTGRPARWSHLMADTHDQLMQAAMDLGLRLEWIQHEGTHREHFDVTETVRQRAIAAGIAVPMAYPRETGILLARKRAELEPLVVHGIDRRSQEHLCGVGPGLGTDSREPAMEITCPLCRLVLERDGGA